MTYSIEHTDNDCDKCLKRVGKINLIKLPFLYLDRNDKIHKDVRLEMKDYKQYYVCKECNRKC